MLFPNNDAVLQDDNLPIHTANSVHSWLEKHENAPQHLPWPAESPDFNITEPPWSVLESRLRSRLPPPSSLKQLKDVLHKEWYNIPLEAIQNSHKSIPRRIQTYITSKWCPNSTLTLFKPTGNFTYHQV
jgi:hypothetical protein